LPGSDWYRFGRYGPSFAAKAWKPTIPLWILFLAVQFVDIVWSIFVLLGIEKVRIVPGFHRHESFRPLLHAVHAQSAGRARVVRDRRPRIPSFSRAGGLLAAGLSGPPYSRTGLRSDRHRPDLGLYGDAYKVGFGLWNYPALAFVLEIVLPVRRHSPYLRATEPKDNIGRYGMLIFGLIAVALQAYVFFGPPPVSDSAFATTALVQYAALAAAVYWLEGKRS